MSTLQNVFTLALRIETYLKRKNRARKSYSPNHYYSHSWKGKAKEKHDKSPSKSHQAPSSKNKSPSGHTHHSTSQRSSSIKCFKCSRYKHIALNCPIKRTMILKKSDDDSEHFSSPSPQITSSNTSSSSIERTKPLESGLLVLRRLLGQVPKELYPSQRQNIFHGGCLISDKICPFIIDSGSCVNMASPRVVDKLGLKTFGHTKPYKLSWLKEEEIKVTKQVLINFSIGNFKDEVLCDIVPMEGNHILLGRPWQFDRKVVYDGHANTYVLFFLGKKFTILPPEENEDKNKIKDDKEKKGDKL